MTKKIVPVSIGIFWDLQDSEGISLWMQIRDDHDEGDSSFNGLLEFPGGKIEKGESVLEALVREIQEEVGIDISGEKRIKFFGHYKVEREKVDIILHVFLIYGDQNLLKTGHWIRFRKGEGAEKIMAKTFVPNKKIIDDVLTWIQTVQNIEGGEAMIWD
ncbi:MAG: NUDIX domain-containing protein [Bacteriovoracales bacterium]|nr:NUDIX domain-containing protein [Bacteriovoracales bacterium]